MPLQVDNEKCLGEHFLDLRDDLCLATTGDRELLAASAALHGGAGATEYDLGAVAFRARNLEEP